MSQWIDALAQEDLPTDDVLGVAVAGRDLAVYTVGAAVYASDDTCTHGQARLCVGFLDGYAIECPLHQGKFDIRDGRALCAPATQPIRTYPVKIEGNRVFIELD